jgi:hypothetical protein
MFAITAILAQVRRSSPNFIFSGKHPIFFRISFFITTAEEHIGGVESAATSK